MFIFFVCLSHRGRLISVKLVKMPKHKLVRHCSTGRALYSDKARSFSQSERALYRNFIIKKIKAKKFADLIPSYKRVWMGLTDN